MTVWCSGRGGLCAAGGLGFESRRPRSREIYAKKAGDGWALTGGGLHQLKQIFHFFLVKFPIFSGFFRFQLCRVSGTRQRLCRVPDKRHSTKKSLPTHFLPSDLCRVQIGLCRVPLALGKFTESGSALRIRDRLCTWFFNFSAIVALSF